MKESNLKDSDYLQMEMLLDGGNIRMCRDFCKMKEKTQIIIGTATTYSLFAEYWPNDLITELRSQDPKSKMNDSQLIEDNKPIKYFGFKNESDWEGINKTLEILENVRVKIVKKNKSEKK